MQDNAILEKMNELTGGEFSYLRLKSVEISEKSAACVVTYLYPETPDGIAQEDMDKIAALTRKIIELNTAEILFKKSHLDAEFIKADIFRFMSESPAIGFLLDQKDISVAVRGGAVDVDISLFGSVYDYAVKTGLKQKLFDLLNKNYCAEFLIGFKVKAGEITAAPRDDEAVYKAFGAKTVSIQEVEKFIGNIVVDAPRRIVDVKTPANNICVCGTIKYINRYDIKKGKNPEGRHVFNYTIEDYSGKIKVVYFSKVDTDKRADTLIEGTKIVVRGNVEQDNYSGMSRLVLFAYDISLCEILPEKKEKIVKAPPPKKYRTVFPEKVTYQHQEDFLTENQGLCPLLQNNSFVVFDVETTGLNIDDKIIELSGCKIEGGVITEHFSTLIDPEMLIPAESTKINFISNQMVADAPKINEVIGDFYKFCENCSIVAHNIEFDHGFITRAGAEEHYVFDHKKYDTVHIARKHIPNLSNYSLKNVCRVLNIVNETAHRALSDAIATAKAFIKLAERIE